jgi:CBS domain-containing protein
MSTRPATVARVISDVMTREPVCVTGDTTVRELARILDANEISGCPVVDALGRIIGVASRTDLLHRALEGPLGSRRSLFETLAEGLRGDASAAENLGSVEDIMTPEPVTATSDEPLGAVARRMADERVHRVVVVDQGRHVIGIVTTLDLLREFPV